MERYRLSVTFGGLLGHETRVIAKEYLKDRDSSLPVVPETSLKVVGPINVYDHRRGLGRTKLGIVFCHQKLWLPLSLVFSAEWHIASL